jgi:hypothetical protein
MVFAFTLIKDASIAQEANDKFKKPCHDFFEWLIHEHGDVKGLLRILVSGQLDFNALAVGLDFLCGECLSEPGVINFLISTTYHDNSTVREAALNALDEYSSLDFRERLCAIAKDDPSPTLKSMAQFKLDTEYWANDSYAYAFLKSRKKLGLRIMREPLAYCETFESSASLVKMELRQFCYDLNPLVGERLGFSYDDDGCYLKVDFSPEIHVNIKYANKSTGSAFPVSIEAQNCHFLVRTHEILKSTLKSWFLNPDFMKELDSQ